MVRRSRRLLLCQDDASFQLWQAGALRHRLVAQFPRTDAGWQAARTQFDAVDPTGADVPSPGSPYRPRRLTRLSAVLVVAAVVVAVGMLAAVGALSRSDGGQQGLRGWIYQDSTSAVFVQWTRAGNSVQGSMSVANMDSAQATSVSNQNTAFMGSISGRSVSLSFNALLGLTTTVAGQLNGSSIVLSVPQKDGSLQSIALRPATTADYNTDVSTLQTTASANQQAADQASASAAESAAAASAQAAAGQAVDAAASTLAEAITAATADTGTLTTDTAAISAAQGPLDQEAQALATTQADAGKVEQEAKSAQPGDPGSALTPPVSRATRPVSTATTPVSNPRSPA